MEVPYNVALFGLVAYNDIWKTWAGDVFFPPMMEDFYGPIIIYIYILYTDIFRYTVIHYIMVDFCVFFDFVDNIPVPWILCMGFGKKQWRVDLQTFCGRVGWEGKEDFWHVFFVKGALAWRFTCEVAALLCLFYEMFFFLSCLFEESTILMAHSGGLVVYTLENERQRQYKHQQKLNSTQKGWDDVPFVSFCRQFWGEHLSWMTWRCVNCVQSTKKQMRNKDTKPHLTEWRDLHLKVIFISEWTLNFPKFRYNFW